MLKHQYLVFLRRGASFSEVVMLGWSEGQQVVSLQRLAFPHAGPSSGTYASMIGVDEDCDCGVGMPNKLLPMQTLSSGEEHQLIEHVGGSLFQSSEPSCKHVTLLLKSLTDWISCQTLFVHELTKQELQLLCKLTSR